MRRGQVTFFIFFTILLSIGCKEAFVPKLDPAHTNFLVVEGNINAGGVTTIKLSRTVPVNDSTPIQSESQAQVIVEGEDNSNYQLVETGGGIYTSSSLALNPTIKYRLRINTLVGGSYLSDYVAVQNTPAIDSVNWEIENNGVQLYVNTHDPLNNTHYYKWEYEETWEIHSAHETGYVYKDGFVSERDVDEIPKLYYCWQSQNSIDIMVGSSAQLASDVISRKPMVSIPRTSVKTSVRYSILVKQYAISKQGYDFYQLMKKNTESMGSIFDPLPSELTGNITCVSDPKEKVVGFITASTVSEKRIFITRNDIGGSLYGRDCEVTLVADNVDSFATFYGDGGLAPFGRTSDRTHYYSTYASCLDCRFLGTNVKPSFW